jgi:UDP-galactopyranose mutase
MLIDNMDLVCFSHLRWNFVFQRPQHLLSRFAKKMRVFYIEEPMFGKDSNSLDVTYPGENICIIVPQFTHGLSYEERIAIEQNLISEFLAEHKVEQYITWYYSPMFVPIGKFLSPRFVVYDCMDELSAFKFAPKDLKENEEELFRISDIVFTGGNSLYEAKKDRHANIHAFPSSIEKEHFGRARTISEDPADQKDIPFPRFGFYGVVDERMDLDLISKVAAAKPDWHFVIIGPVVKIDPNSLPRSENIHFIGGKSYQELPTYLAGWDVALIPFALNESTRFISPTKTPEYLSAGKPVISSSIHDVVNPYGNEKLVHIADTPEQFIQAGESELGRVDKSEWLSHVDFFLLENSWDNTWNRMWELMNDTLLNKTEQKKNFNQISKEYICLTI